MEILPLRESGMKARSRGGRRIRLAGFRFHHGLDLLNHVVEHGQVGLGHLRSPPLEIGQQVGKLLRWERLDLLQRHADLHQLLLGQCPLIDRSPLRTGHDGAVVRPDRDARQRQVALVANLGRRVEHVFADRH